MDIKTEADITARTARQLRDARKLSQKEFWGAVCVTGARGCAYETARTSPIPPEIRRLVYLHYVVGIPTDATREELQGTVDTAALTSEARQIAATTRQVTQKVSEAKKITAQARDLLNKALEVVSV